MIQQSFQLAKKIADGAVMDEVGEVIERCRIAVDNREEGAAAFGNDREGGRRLDLQGRTDHDENFGLLAPALGALHGFDRHRLSEGNIGRFQESAAGVASRCRQRFVPSFINLARLKCFAAFKAGDEPVRAVQLNQPRFRNAGELV